MSNVYDLYKRIKIYKYLTTQFHIKIYVFNFEKRGKIIVYKTKNFNLFYANKYSQITLYGGYAGYDPSCDYAFVQLSSDVGTYTGHFGFTTLCYTDTVIYAAGYPGGAPYLYNCAGVVNSYTDTLMYISADFTAGQSGGPIYIIASDGMPYLMGVISGNSYDINIGRRIDYGLYQWLSQNGYL